MCTAFCIAVILYMDFTESALISYRAVRVGGPLLCALETPDVTNAVRSQLECSEQCSEDTSCTSFNFKKAGGTKPTCERFYGCFPGIISVMQNCAHYRKRFLQLSDPCKILVQQHVDNSASFNRTWNEYKAGFGDLNCNYWLGNEQLYQLTQSKSYKLRVELQSSDNLLWYWAEYSTFQVASETQRYRLTVSGYTGNVRNSTMTDPKYGNNGMMFSTWDRDNDRVVGKSCAASEGGGFWFNDCGFCHLNSDFGWFRWAYLYNTSLILLSSRMWLLCP